jgi:hypothetical protein
MMSIPDHENDCLTDACRGPERAGARATMKGDAGARGEPRRGSLEQRAVEQLRAVAAPWRFRVQEDAEGFPLIPGRWGQIEWFDGRDLAVYTTHPRLFRKLWAIPGMRRHQTGDTEIRAVFPPAALERVAIVIKARRRRTLTPEQARRLGAKTAYKATS